MVNKKELEDERIKVADLLPSGKQTPVFTLTLEQIEPILKSWIQDCLDYGPVSQSDNFPKLYTRQEAASVLHISLPTLHVYTKLGLIRATRTGTRVLYSDADLKEALVEIPSKLNRGNK